MSETATHRKLAAILFADIVGFTEQVHADETTGLEHRRSFEKLVRNSAASHLGRVVKMLGDGALVAFDSAVEAVSCALDIQEQIAASRTPGGPTYAARIGVHVGDIVEEGGDIHGNAVNVAERVHEAAEPGGICITRCVYSQIRPILKIRCQRIRGRTTKPMPEAMEVFSIGPDENRPHDAGATATRRAAPAPARVRRSLWLSPVARVVAVLAIVVGIVGLAMALVGPRDCRLRVANAYRVGRTCYVLQMRGENWTEGKPELRMVAKLRWSAPWYAVLKLHAAEGSRAHSRYIRGPGLDDHALVPEYGEGANRYYQIRSVLRSCGDPIQVRFVPLRTDMKLLVTTGPRMSPVEEFATNETVGDEKLEQSGRELRVEVPMTGSTRVNFHNLTDPSRPLTVLMYPVNSPSLFRIEGIDLTGPIQITPGRQQTATVTCTGSPPGDGQAIEEDWRFVTTDATHQVLHVRLRTMNVPRKPDAGLPTGGLPKGPGTRAVTSPAAKSPPKPYAFVSPTVAPGRQFAIGGRTLGTVGKVMLGSEDAIVVRWTPTRIIAELPAGLPVNESIPVNVIPRGRNPISAGNIKILDAAPAAAGGPSPDGRRGVRSSPPPTGAPRGPRTVGVGAGAAYLALLSSDTFADDRGIPGIHAAGLADRALMRNPNDPLALGVRGYALLRDERPVEAAAPISRALRLTNGQSGRARAVALTASAFLCEMRADPTSAERQYKAAIEADRRCVLASYGFACYLLDNNRRMEADDVVRAALRNSLAEAKSSARFMELARRLGVR